MFIGHNAVGFASKKLAPSTSLLLLMGAPMLLDLLWPIFLLLGWEHSHVVPGPNPFLTLWLDDIPYSHSLFALIVWGALFGYLYRRRTGDTRTALVIGSLVVSHWVLDFVTHRPDMPLYPGSASFGLGLWNSPPATIIVEAAMLLAGVAIYTRVTRARDGIGRWGFCRGVRHRIARSLPRRANTVAQEAQSTEGLILQHAVHADAHRYARARDLRSRLRMVIRRVGLVGGSAS